MFTDMPTVACEAAISLDYERNGVRNDKEYAAKIVTWITKVIESYEDSDASWNFDMTGALLIYRTCLEMRIAHHGDPRLVKDLLIRIIPIRDRLQDFAETSSGQFQFAPGEYERLRDFCLWLSRFAQAYEHEFQTDIYLLA